MRHSLTGVSVKEAAQLCRHAPDNWRSFAAACEREYARLADPVLAAKVCAVALKLQQPVPPWAADWLATGLEKAIRHDGGLDNFLGFVARGSGAKSVAQRRKWQNRDDLIMLIMPILIDQGRTQEQAADHLAELLIRQWDYTKLDAETVIKRWRQLRSAQDSE